MTVLMPGFNGGTFNNVRMRGTLSRCESAITVKKRSIKSDLARVDAHRITKAEYEEAPELTTEMLDRAEIRHGNKIIKRGRPPLENPKEAVKLRLDHDVLAAYRKTGTGWQTRINADLRKAARKLAG